MSRGFSLSYGSTLLSWGPADSPIVNAKAPEWGDAEWQTDDVNRPRGDGRAFGVDYVGGQTLTFTLGLHASDEGAVRTLERQLHAVWRADAVRRSPGAVAQLVGEWTPGQPRLVFGRPRRYAVDDDAAPGGTIIVTATFDCVDDVFYDVSPSSRALALVPGGAPSPGGGSTAGAYGTGPYGQGAYGVGATGVQPLTGGLVAPLASPLTTTLTSDRSTVVDVGGDVDAWPVVTIHGPITNPVVDIVGVWRLEVRTRLEAGHTITIDTRPWARKVVRDGAGSLAGAVSSASARLSQASLPPGRHELALRGVDATGTATLELAWRNGYVSP